MITATALSHDDALVIAEHHYLPAGLTHEDARQTLRSRVARDVMTLDEALLSVIAHAEAVRTNLRRGYATDATLVTASAASSVAADAALSAAYRAAVSIAHTLQSAAERDAATISTSEG